jgi:hypothetical protein
LRAGVVSVRQAKAIGAAEAVDPGAGRRLLDAATDRSTKETEDAAALVVAAASSETGAQRAERHRRQRKVFHGVNADGMGYGGWMLPIAEHVRVVAQLEGEQSKVFAAARAGGVREPVEAYAADAFCRVFDRAARGGDAIEGTGPVDDWSFAKMIVRVDLAALDRGELAPGEVCEVAGRGPIPVADAWRMIAGDAFVAAVTTNGTKIDQVVHLGRKPTVLQRTALEWFSAGECSIEGCTSPARIEIDHVADWADTEITTLSELASPCGYHHDLKSHHGYRFGPRLPSGKRRLIPPGGADPPDESPPGLTLLHGTAHPEPRGAGPARGDPTQGDLFDTG